MTLDVRSAKDNLILLLEGTPGLQGVVDGAPESMPYQATAWVNVGDLVEPVNAIASSGLYQLDINLIVVIGFVVETNEANAEDSVSDIVTEIVRRVAQNRVTTVNDVTPMLNGSVARMNLPGPAAVTGEYVTMAGEETRTYPLAIQVSQQETIAS
jgi:predicted RNA-binding protein with TRAM domain